MTELHERARALLEATRLADEPTEADEQRVRAALMMRIAAGALVGTAAAATATKAGAVAIAGKVAGPAALASGVTAGSAGAVGTVGVVGAAGTAGTGLVGASTSTLSLGLIVKVVGLGVTAAGLLTVGAVTVGPRYFAEPAKSVSQASVMSAPSASSLVKSPVAVAAAESAPSPEPSAQEAPVASAEAVQAPAVPSASTPKRPVPQASGLVSTLDEELGLIREAQAALHSGQASRALTILDEHQRRYPSGVLGEDRAALRILALCASGRGADARKEAQRFVQGHPRSTYVSPISSACGFASPQ